MVPEEILATEMLIATVTEVEVMIVTSYLEFEVKREI